MSLSWIGRLLLVWAQVVASGIDPLSCERLYDMSPASTLPPGKTYEEWYGSPALLCGSAHRVRVFCIGSNC